MVRSAAARTLVDAAASARISAEALVEVAADLVGVARLSLTVVSRLRGGGVARALAPDEVFRLEAGVDCCPSRVVPTKHVAAALVVEVEMVCEDCRPLVILAELDDAREVRGATGRDLVERHRIAAGGREPSEHIEESAEGDI